MDGSLYDEFGNYIGPDLESSASEDDHEIAEDQIEDADNAKQDEIESVQPSIESAIILHEDKQYYPDADEVYPGVETTVQDEDTQDISEPIIKPIKPKFFSVLEKEIPKTTYSFDFLTSLMNDGENIRNVVILGGLHCGKTTFMDMLIEETREKQWDNNKNYLYTDTLKVEHERGVSLISTPISIVLQSSTSKHYLLNFIDIPGHCDFIGEVSVGVRVADGALLIVDAVEGVVMNTKLHLELAIKENLNIILVINKMDKYILNLREPPGEAYNKIMHLIEEANSALAEFDVNKKYEPFHPSSGNVIFCSSKHRWAFTLQSYIQLYERKYSFNTFEFSKYCWGNFYFNPETRGFDNKIPKDGIQRVFTQFFLEPIYKVYTQAIGEDRKSISNTLRALNIRFHKSDLSLDADPILRLIMKQYFDRNVCIVDSILSCIPSPISNAINKIKNIYTGKMTTKVAESLNCCNSKGPLVIQIAKLYSTPDAKDFTAFGRILSGTLLSNSEVAILGDKYTLIDPEDRAQSKVLGISIPQARYTLQIDKAPAGNWVLIDGISQTIIQSSTIININDTETEILLPYNKLHKSCIKVSIEALKPSDVPKMEHGIRCICKIYPLLNHKVEESGEHVLIGTGELQLDCALYDLRKVFGDLEVKVSNPIVSFSETVIETSSLNCFVDTSNKANRLMMIAEPLEDKLSNDIELGKISLTQNIKDISLFFQVHHKWDILSSRNVWAFGPDINGPNILCDDTLPDECRPDLLSDIRDNIVQGFRWACKEGPLCDEPIRNVKFKIMNANISDDPILRGAGQIIPAARRLVYGSFLMATPRLMEPISTVEIMCPADLVKEVYKVLQERRGHGTSERPKPGSPFFIVTAYLPMIESFGFETDLRIHTQGLAFCQQIFNHWSLIPSDPFDETVVLHAIEPAETQALAKDFMLKTRRRKGLAEDVNIRKYFDEAMLEELARNEGLLNN